MIPRKWDSMVCRRDFYYFMGRLNLSKKLRWTRYCFKLRSSNTMKNFVFDILRLF